MPEFGPGFKKAREGLGLSLEDVASETRISVRFLQAIESEDFQRLPGGVFNRGFIKAFAERIGIDPIAALAEYDRLARGRESDPVPRSQDEALEAPVRLSWIIYPIGAVILILAIAGYFFLTRGSEAPGATTPPIIASSPPTVSSPPIPAPSAVPTPAAAAPAPQNEPPPPATPGAASEVTLEFTATEPTWIRILADGSPPFEEILQPGVTRRFTANNSIDVVIGNAGGVSLRVNDRDLGSIGRPGQVRSFVLTPGNVDEIDEIIG
jgi:cytoskeletal protein RodZ